MRILFPQIFACLNVPCPFWHRQLSQNVVPQSSFQCVRARAGRNSRANRSCKFGSLSRTRAKGPRVASPSCRISRLDVATGGEIRAFARLVFRSVIRDLAQFFGGEVYLSIYCFAFCRASECFGFGTVPVPRSDCTF